MKHANNYVQKIKIFTMNLTFFTNETLQNQTASTTGYVLGLEGSVITFSFLFYDDFCRSVPITVHSANNCT